MANTKTFQVTYDSDSDVLYIHYRKIPAARGIEDDEGVVWRYDSTGELIGVTVVDFESYWSGHRSQLARRISTGFNITDSQDHLEKDV